MLFRIVVVIISKKTTERWEKRTISAITLAVIVSYKQFTIITINVADESLSEPDNQI